MVILFSGDNLKDELIEIDGSYLEGGGQIVRTALALSTITGKPFKVDNIRKNRPNPGLKNQHLYAIKALKELCNADVKGDYLGSTSLIYYPNSLNYHNLNIDIETAGSITLFFQAIMPVILFSDKKLTIKVRGGTDTSHSPSIDYFNNVFLHYLQPYADINLKIEKRGYYPKGDGKVVLKISPKYSISGFNSFEEFLEFIREEKKGIYLEKRPPLVLIKGISHASKDLMNANVAERQARQARYILNKFNVPVKIQTEYVDTLSTGSGITLWAIFSENEKSVILGSDALGEKGKKSEIVGEEAAKQLSKDIENGEWIDKYLLDQLMPYVVLFGGKISYSEMSNHAKTNAYVIHKFLTNLKIENRNLSSPNLS
ncbi:MAG: RNA 3'-terminal phosphate cyclase [Candidatus Pacearchaeota archaeon]